MLQVMPLRAVQVVAFTFFGLLLFSANANEAKRLALVIGNGAYQSAPLKNPTNDAADMATQLKKLGFEVIHVANGSQKQMRQKIREFGRSLKSADVGLFFYAGHGMQVQGKNYLIPVDADIQSEDEVQDYGVDAGMVLRKMESAGNPLNMVFLDACRDNPFSRSFRSAQGGLAQMDAPSGSLIAYATAPGKTAADGDGRNGVFTRHLLAHLKASGGIELAQVMKKVGKGVQTETGKQQVPWISSSITGDFYFNGQKGAINAVIETVVHPVVNQVNVEEEFWAAIKSSSSKADFQDYLETYPNGRFKQIAKLKIRQSNRAAVVVRPTPAPAPIQQALNIAGDYRVAGTNPNGTTYSGSVKIWRASGQYNMQWRIATSVYSGQGTLSGRTLTINWGDATPVIYTVTSSGVLDGKWSGGSASEILTPMR